MEKTEKRLLDIDDLIMGEAMQRIIENIASQIGVALDTVLATVDDNVGVPSVTPTWDKVNKTLSFAFSNLKGERGKQGIQGPQGENFQPIEDVSGIVIANTFGDDNSKLISQGGMTSMLTFSDGVTNSSELTSRPCSLGTDKWYRSSSSGPQSHVAIPVTPGQMIRVTPSSTSGSYYGFLTSSYSISTTYTTNSSIPYISGETRRYFSKVEAKIIEIPDNCAWLILTTCDGASNTPSWTIEPIESLKTRILNMESDTDNFKNKVTTDVVIDTSNIRIADWFIQNNGKWGTGLGRWQCKLLDISRYKGDEITLTKSANGSSKYGFLKSDTRTNNSTPDWCSGETMKTLSSSSVHEIVPSDANVLYIYVNADGTNVTPSISVRLPLSKHVGYAFSDYTASTPVKLRIAHWNVGHFSLGENYETAITHEAYADMRQKWAKKIDEIGADLFLCCEYSNNFVNSDGVNDAILARDVIFSPYSKAYIGSRPSASSYMQTAMFANLPITNITEVIYTNSVQVGRYYQVGDLYLYGVLVKVVETHLDFNQGSNGATYRAQQIQKLISDFENYQYVIIAADFNVANSSEYNTFASAGYKMFSHGFVGDIPNASVDNILCKGFSISRTHVVNDAELSDHAAIYADFTLIR